MDHRDSGIAFVCEVKPIAQPRHRATCRGGFARMYLPTQHPIHAYKAAIQGAVRAQNKDVPRFAGPVKVAIAFGFKYKAARGAASHRVAKPDLDNLIKAVLDALTDEGIWEDDAQVAMLESVKLNTDRDWVSVRVCSLPNLWSA